MTGPEHYKEAERLLAVADTGGLADHPVTVAAAQAHATLALAAATASSLDKVGLVDEEAIVWYEAVSNAR